MTNWECKLQGQVICHRSIGINGIKNQINLYLSLGLYTWKPSGRENLDWNIRGFMCRGAGNKFFGIGAHKKTWSCYFTISEKCYDNRYIVCEPNSAVQDILTSSQKEFLQETLHTMKNLNQHLNEHFKNWFKSRKAQ